MSHRGSLRSRFGSVGWGWALRLRIFNQLPSDDSEAGLVESDLEANKLAQKTAQRQLRRDRCHQISSHTPLLCGPQQKEHKHPHTQAPDERQEETSLRKSACTGSS